MKPFKLNKNANPGGYMQFWTGQKPPVLIVTKFPKPHVPLKLITKVEPQGNPIEFVYRS
jgi:hypothetical protein